jgi:hypothetical protein
VTAELFKHASYDRLFLPEGMSYDETSDDLSRIKIAVNNVQAGDFESVSFLFNWNPTETEDAPATKEPFNKAHITRLLYVDGGNTLRQDEVVFKSSGRIYRRINDRHIIFEGEDSEPKYRRVSEPKVYEVTEKDQLDSIINGLDKTLKRVGFDF